MFKQFWHGAESCRLLLLSNLTTYTVVFLNNFVISNKSLFLCLVADFYTITVFSICIRCARMKHIPQ